MPTTYYDWDELEDNIAAEHDEAGNLIAEYTHEPGFHGSLVSEHRGGQTLQHHYDAQGNSLALSDDSGNVVDTFGHTAFRDAIPVRRGTRVLLGSRDRRVLGAPADVGSRTGSLVVGGPDAAGGTAETFRLHGKHFS